jgi:hypothetical protein
MKKTEEELDKLHESTMLNLYEIFEDEFDRYFKFYEASMRVLECGTGVFPFSTHYSCVMDDIEKSLDLIEKNILEHIREELREIFKKRKEFELVNYYSEKQKNNLSEKIRETAREILSERELF